MSVPEAFNLARIFDLIEPRANLLACRILHILAEQRHDL
jgi:hypothetical protein